MDKDDLKRKLEELRNEKGEAVLANVDAMWSFSDWLGKVSRRCRRCYPKIMIAVANSQDVTQWSWYEENLCKDCMALAKAKLNVLEMKK